MNQRIQTAKVLPNAYKKLIAFSTAVEAEAAGAGIEPKLLELIKIRASQINGCAFCLNMHTADARKLGETERRIFLLNAWRETELYTETERAALELTEAITRLSETADISDEVYQRSTKVLTEQQYSVVVWEAMTINTFNRLAVSGHSPLPEEN